MAIDFGGIIGIFIPMIVIQIQKAIDEGLDKLAVSKPKLFKTIVVIGHFTFTHYGVDIAADTTNTYDDTGVAGVIAELARNAEEHNITLAA